MPRILQGPLKRALIVENPHKSIDQMLIEAGFEVERLDFSPDADELGEILSKGGHQILFKRSRVPVTKEVIDRAKDLVAIQLCCIGDDSVDKAACADAGVLVFNDPVSNGRSVVELVMGHLIGLSRQLFETYRSTHAGVWEKSATARYEIHGKVLGVYGLGRIGRATARAAEAFGMKILFWDTREVAIEVGEEMGWTKAESPLELFSGSDAVSMHVSATDTEGQDNTMLITKELFMSLGREMGDNSPRIFINLARGVIYNPEDLLEAIESGAVRRAAVDVFPLEPGNNTKEWANPFSGEFRVATTPHIGAATQEAQPRIARRVVNTSLAYSNLGSIRDCVLSPRTKIALTENLDDKTILLVVHSTERGTKKALDDAIYEANADNLMSTHRDFSMWGVAVNVNLLDRPLNEKQLKDIVTRTTSVTGDNKAVRLIRQITS
jgi:D-3-phosphoglycerate dehydrogenase / 2-oxoglutarate reductase